MQTFRKTWLVLMGAILLVTLSVSAAFAAKPEASADGNRGQTVAGFVHELVFGSNEETDEETEQDEEDLDEDEDLEGDVDEDSEEDTEEELEEDLEEDSEDVEGSEERATGAEHGTCVSEEASSKEGEDGSHGEVVSLAARETCWEPADDAEATDADGDEGEEDSRQAAKAERKAAQIAARNAARADRLAAKAERDAARAERHAARAERHAAKATAAASRGQGRGH